MVSKLRKVTVLLPADLVSVAAGEAFDGLRRLRGKLKRSLNVDKLRRDR